MSDNRLQIMRMITSTKRKKKFFLGVFEGFRRPMTQNSFLLINSRELFLKKKKKLEECSSLVIWGRKVVSLCIWRQLSLKIIHPFVNLISFH